MGVLTGTDEAQNQISITEIAFVGRLAAVKLTMSTRSIPPINYYQLVFEDNIKSVKGSAPTTNKFSYQQRGKGGKLFKIDGSSEDMPAPKEPQAGQFYVATYDTDANRIQTLIEINENDLSLF